MCLRRALRSLTVVTFVFVGLQLLGGHLGTVQAGDDSGSGTSYYAGLSCGKLWYERNAIFASKGQCFKTNRAIATFGKACFPPYGRLPGHLSRVVKEIKRWERRKGC